MDVGVKELRDSLSRYLHVVESGQPITVTAHGRPLIRLVPLDGPSAVEVLRAKGIAVRPGAGPGDLPPLTPATGSVSELVGQQRG